jgi:hypothetical protein
VIYFYRVTGALIVLFDMHAKNAKENLSHADQRDLKAAITDLITAARANRPG